MKRRARPSNALYSLIRLTTARRRSWTGCLVNPVKALQPREPTPQQRRLAFADLNFSLEGMMVVLLGVGLGSLGAFALTRVMSSLL
jgi:hypothetical protein